MGPYCFTIDVQCNDLSDLRLCRTYFYLLCTVFILDEWDNFLERIGRGDSGDAELQENSRDSLELRFWASYRGQTLARTG